MIQPGMWYQGIIFNLRFLENDKRHVVAKITHHKEAEKFVKFCKKKLKSYLNRYPLLTPDGSVWSEQLDLEVKRNVDGDRIHSWHRYKSKNEFNSCL